MNKLNTARRLSRLLALALSSLFYIAAGVLIRSWTQNRSAERPAFSPPAVNLSFAQIELQAAEPPPVIEPEPVPEPEEIAPEPLPPEKNDMAKEELPETRTEPEPEPRSPEAQVTQEASAPTIQPVAPNILRAWVREQIEKEKYYPPSARNAGYEGGFRLLVKIGTDGKISEARVLGGHGHSLLRRAVEKITGSLPGRDFGQPIPEPVELPFEFEFKLN
ncbi:MAG: periplasmic protein TonB [Verrucomicrobiota bacterium]|nr:periplasmic protein TonB [Verrucomicrobiota bacterium]MDK2962882.1 periplasmic protein TonB [Verrucomicrobiota bacterium]